jgi:hypothetical protein
VTIAIPNLEGFRHSSLSEQAKWIDAIINWATLIEKEGKAAFRRV